MADGKEKLLSEVVVVGILNSGGFFVFGVLVFWAPDWSVESSDKTSVMLVLPTFCSELQKY